MKIKEGGTIDTILKSLGKELEKYKFLQTSEEIARYVKIRLSLTDGLNTPFPKSFKEKIDNIYYSILNEVLPSKYIESGKKEFYSSNFSGMNIN